MTVEEREDIVKNIGNTYISKLSTVLPVELIETLSLPISLSFLAKRGFYNYQILDEKKFLLFCIKHNMQISVVNLDNHE